MKRVVLALAFVFFLASFAQVAEAASVKFQWTPSTSADAAGYRLFWKNKTTSTLTKLGNDVAGKTTSTATVDIPTVEGADTYVVVAKTYDLAGNESVESNEALKDGTVFTWKDTTPPAAPGVLQVLQQIADSLERIAAALDKNQ